MRQYAVILIGFPFMILSPALAAQNYPAKPIRYIVPFPAGGTTDILARLIGAKLTEAWGQQILVDNRPGAGGNVGSEIASKAPADGYTILGGTVSSHSINTNLYSKMPYHPLRDFAPITLLVMVPNVLVVHPTVPAKSVKEFIALAKARPGQLRFASAGNGTSQHLSGELFMMLTGTKMIHVPYKGSAPASSDLVGGQIELSFENTTIAVPFIKGGRMRALGVTTAKRTGALPDTPTIAEAGVPGFEVSSWQGVFAPAGTPPDILKKLNVEIVRIIGLPDIQRRLADIGADPVGNTPEQFTAFIKTELDKWQKVVKASGARVD
jgi:tripartite-type tricarboxylate transporter receptor subunit TctC